MNHQHGSIDLILPLETYHEQKYKIVLEWNLEELHNKFLQNRKVFIQSLQKRCMFTKVGKYLVAKYSSTIESFVM